jgi:alpha-glucosidase (family GH31 glycosyl hydrolase)
VTVTEDHIPVFVRGGAFLPMIKTIQNTSKYSLSNFDLHYYFDAKTPSSQGKIYQDDGATPNAFEKGAYEILNFKANSTSKELTITFSPEVGKSFQSTDKNVTLLLHHLDAKVSTVSVNGKQIAFTTINNNTIQIRVLWKKGTSQEIKIHY